MAEFKDRLKEAIEISGLKPAEIVELSGINKGALSSYLSGRYKPKQDNLYLLSKTLNVSESWLMGLDVPRERVPDRLRWKDKKPCLIPVLGRIAAGIPIDAVTDVLDYEEITAELAATGTFFALKVKGDSMSPRLYEGDVVIVKQQPDIESGDVAVVLVNGTDATLKQVIKQDGGILLQAYNPSVFPTRFYSNQDIANLPVKILGKAVEARKKL